MTHPLKYNQTKILSCIFLPHSLSDHNTAVQDTPSYYRHSHYIPQTVQYDDDVSRPSSIQCCTLTLHLALHYTYNNTLLLLNGLLIAMDNPKSHTYK